MKTLQSKSDQHWGNKMFLPHLGLVTISETGTIETDNEEAITCLTEQTNGEWELVGGKASKCKKKKEEVEEEIPAEVEETEEEESAQSSLESLELEDLVELVVEAGYPAKEYKAFKGKKKLMIAYITKKQSEA